MISIHVLLVVFICMFAFLGATRGWAKELLVTFSAVLALFILNILESYIPSFTNVMSTSSAGAAFWIQTGIIAGIIFLGYQAPKLPRLENSGRFMRVFWPDTLIGGFLGAINGLLLFGSIWFYLNSAGYPFAAIVAPDPATEVGLAALGWLKFLPPTWLLGSPAIYFAVAILLISVLVVFL
jgi:hypothetical protein